MKEAFKVKAAKVTLAVLVAAMTFALIPKFIGNDVVLAAGTKNDENTCLGTSKMASPATPTADSEWSGSKVYFGTYGDEPILFRVLAPSTLAYGESTLFLDSDKTLFRAYFDNTSPYSNSWANSDIRATLNGSFLNGFTDLEKEAIAMSSDNGGCSYAADSWQKYVYGSPVSVNDKVFLLDAAEITNEAYGYSSDTGFTLISGTWSDGDYSWHTVPNHIKGGSSDYWWLRSANSSYNYYAGTVFYIGSLSDNDVRGAKVGVAPALNINQSSIIFSSLISGSFNTVGAEYKLTIKDPDLDIAVPAGQQVDVSGTTVTVPYEIGGANAGTATRASILITDKKWDASGATIKLYDALGTNTDTSGTFTLPSDLDLSGWGTDYHVYILAEDINDGHDGKDTDYASALQEVTIPEPVTYYTVTFVDGQGKTLKTEKVESGKAATAPTDPKRSGYTFTGWDKDFSKVTADLTVTAQWKKNATAVSGTLLSKMTAKGKNSLILTWNKVNGAEGYDIFFIKCGKQAPKKVKTIKGNKTFKWTKTGLKKKTPYKAVVKAYVTKNGKKTYVRTSPMVHAYTGGYTKNYTNAKSVKVNKAEVTLADGQTFRIKARVIKRITNKKLMPKSHAATLRFLTSDRKVATVSSKGKITAKGNGTCYVYVYAHNGVSKKIRVTVNTPLMVEGGYACSYKNTITDLASHLKTSTNCQVGNAAIKNITRSCTAGLTEDRTKVIALFNYVRDRIANEDYYDTKYGAADTLRREAGNDVDKTHLLIACLRTAGIPARYCVGTCKFNDGSVRQHVWAECVVKSNWIALDPTDSHNSYGAINSWDTRSCTINGRYVSLPF